MEAHLDRRLRQFQGFNGPMGFPPDYEWYPPFDDVSQTISMKLPDGSLIKMFLQMQGAGLPPAQQAAFMAAVENYPAFSGITLGGHGVLPSDQALGANSCLDCHGVDGVMAAPVQVTRKVPTDMGPMGVLEMPMYTWVYYNVHDLVDLGLIAQSEDIISGATDVDIDGDTNYVRTSNTTIVLNWIMPDAPGGYQAADSAGALDGTGLQPTDLTWSGGSWMPVLEPVTDMVPAYSVLGYQSAEIIW